MNFANRVSYIKSSPIREALKLTNQPGVISFAGGWPAPESFPINELIKISTEVLKEQGKNALQYSSTEGYAPLKEFIAERMTLNGVSAQADDIMITNGSQQGLDFTAKLFINEGDKIICESPSYVGALNAFRAYMPEFIDVKMEHDGMDMNALEEAIIKYKNVKYIYTVPDFQNPTGITMSMEKRKRLVEIAEKYEVPVIEDNPYYEIRFEGEKIPPIKSFDKSGMVIYLGSFSKTFCPGLRIGWIMAEKNILRKYVLIKQGADLQNNTLSQMELSRFLTEYNFDAHINKVTKIYKSRKEAMFNAIKREFPDFIEYTNPKGGLFTWVKLPDKFTSSQVFEKAIEQKVAFIPGDAFYANGSNVNHFRLNFGTVNEELINEGIVRLGKVLKNL